MPKIIINDVEMYYELKGSGFPLVMIMGFAGNLDWWPYNFVKALSKSYQVLLFDTRGTGKTQGKGIVYSMPLLARDTINLMDILGIKQAHLFGISMGGLIAQEMVLRYPDRFNKLILACTSCGIRHGALVSFDRLKLWLKYPFDSRIRSRSLMTNIFFSQKYLNQKMKSVKKRKKNVTRRLPIHDVPIKTKLKQLTGVLFCDTFCRLPQITSKTLIITGTKDFMVPHKNSTILANRIPSTKLVKLKDHGHAFIGESPEEASSIILNFLAVKKSL